jgi:hypothetical protein
MMNRYIVRGVQPRAAAPALRLGGTSVSQAMTHCPNR